MRAGLIDALVTAEGGDDAAALATRFGVTHWSPETASRRRRGWGSGDLGEVATHAGLPAGATVVAAASYPDAGIGGRRVLAARWPLVDRLNDMTWTWRELARSGIRVPAHSSVRLADVAGWTGAHRRDFARLPRSTAGSGVVDLRRPSGPERLLALAPAGTEVLVSEACGDGRTYNAHGLVDADGLVVTYRPSVQLVGLPGLALHGAQYCGNDFASAVADEAVAGVVGAVVRAVGRWLAGLGYVGLFGVDTAIEPDGRGTVIDVNPRLQASTWLLTEAAHAQRLPCPGLAHVAALQGHSAAGPAGPPGDRWAVAQLVLRAGPSRPAAPPLRAGVYDVSGDLPVWDRPAADPAGLGEDEVLVCGTPCTGPVRWPATPGAPEARVVARRAITDDGRGLNRFGTSLVAWCRGARARFTPARADGRAAPSSWPGRPGWTGSERPRAGRGAPR